MSEDEIIFDLVGREFDTEFYAAEYPALGLSAVESLAHFCRIGWFEGRCPNPYFDTVSYLMRYPDIVASRRNPYFHYLFHGREEGRTVVPAVRRSVRAMLCLGYPAADWVDIIRDHVDIEFYRLGVPYPVPLEADLVAHFAFRGWREGLDPNPERSMRQLLAAYPDAAALLVNPLVAHYEALAHRYVPVSREKATETASAEPEYPQDGSFGDINVVAPEFDAAFYLRENRDVLEAGIDALDHYFYTGWREGRNPTPEFDTAWYLDENPDVRAAMVNPFLHYITIGRKAGLLPRRPVLVEHVTQGAAPEPEAAAEAEGEATAEPNFDAIAALIGPEFSTTYYNSQYSDVAEAGVDALLHYIHEGWKEGRNPNKHFDSAYYLESNPDVRKLDLHPFWHYIAAGRAEGRPPCRPGGYRRRILEAVKEPKKRSESYQVKKTKPTARRVLSKLLSKALKKRAGLVVSLSHDCYIKVIGGTQIFIADEQRKFVAREHAYIHLSPFLPKLCMADADAGFSVQIVIDGVFVGIVPIKVLIDLLGTQLDGSGMTCLLVVHSIMGFDPQQVCGLKRALPGSRGVYWLHDYSSLCEGFNLLRNDLAFCDAPAKGSIACRVCVYGETREQHLDRLRGLFEVCEFEILSPSTFTLDLWLSRTDLPYQRAQACPHWGLVPVPDAGAASEERLDPRRPVSVAFVGFASSSKGWDIFSNLVDEFQEDTRYKFYHFAARGVASLPECEFVVSEVTPDDRWATKRTLQENGIDYVAILSPWPETFSFVAHEAVAAGALVLCLETSGNVAAMVTRLNRGHVFASAADIEAFLVSDAACNDAHRRRKEAVSFEIADDGTTAAAFLSREEGMPS